MSELVEKQKKFSLMLADLIQYTDSLGYGVTLGEVWRTEEQAALNAAKGIGIKNSLHRSRLAADLNFFSGDRLVDTPMKVVEYWESIGGTAGIRFGDSPHFSLSYQGVK